MPPFSSLKTISDVAPEQGGETAQLLCQLRQEGQTIADSWVINAETFQYAVQRLVAREPIFADWPKLLWQTASITGYPVQHLAKRLRRPLVNLPTELPWDELLAEIETPVVRLLPSLWFGENLPTAPYLQMLEAPLCWAQPEALEAALKRLWLSFISAKSLAFWSQWKNKQGGSLRDYPSQIAVAVVVQAVEPATLSGTLTLRTREIEIESVRGLAEAIADACPDTYRGPLPIAPNFAWQAGYQEQSYAPNHVELDPHILTPCFVTESVSETALEVINDEAEHALWSAAQGLSDWANHPLKIGWYLSKQTGTFHVFQACWWPMTPAMAPFASATVAEQGLLGHAAAPGKRYGLALVLQADDPLPATAHQQIIVASEVAPEWLPLLKTAAGVISEKGGLTSHAAVLARELGLPAVVGIADATQRFQTGEALLIDGDRGLIEPLTALPTEAIATPSRLPRIFAPPRQTEIWLNLSQPDAAEPLANLPVAGIGLLRSEWLMLPLLDRRHPYQWVAAGQAEALATRLADQLRPLLKAFAPRPLRYRTLDIRSNEFAQLEGAPAIETNPMIGIRGTFSYQQHSDFFRLELAMLRQLQAEGLSNLHLLLPFVRTVKEVDFCKTLIQEMGLDQHPKFELWMMAEVPSVLFALPQYVKAGIQGIAIGTHDLTQLLLGIDRDQVLFSPHFDETDAAVQAAIAQLIQQSRALQIPCCLCGVSPIHHPNFVKTMVREGVSAISVDATALEITAQLIQSVEVSR